MHIGKAETEDVVRVKMFGKLSIVAGGVDIADSMNQMLKLRNILAYIIFHRDRVISKTEMVQQFWRQEGEEAAAHNALKTQIFRIRKLLQDILPGEESFLISSRQGYQWNPAVPVFIDVERFSELYEQYQVETHSRRRLSLAEEAVGLYQGTFLPQLSGQAWVAEAGKDYPEQFLEMLYEYGAHLEDAGEYSALFALMQKARHIHPLCEGIHTTIIRVLMARGDYEAALRHYDYATDLLYRAYGTQQWKGLRELYDKIMEEEQVFELDLDVIQENLQDSDPNDGVFFCEFGNFRTLYLLECRRQERAELPSHLLLCTLQASEKDQLRTKNIERGVMRMKEVLLDCLRKSDVVARYSSMQYLAMLPNTTEENLEQIVERILQNFRRGNHHKLNFSCRFRRVFSTRNWDDDDAAWQSVEE